MDLGELQGRILGNLRGGGEGRERKEKKRKEIIIPNSCE